MSPQEPQPSEDAIQTTSHEAMQHCEKQEDNKIGQEQPQSDRSVPETAKDSTQPPAAGSSAPGPIASSKKWTVQQFWSKHVSVIVDFETCRDHLGYLRTGVVTATLGTVVAQLFVMQPPDSGFGYTTVGKPLATVCYCFSMCITLLGACRVWRIQHAMLLGKTLSGGFEIMTIAAGFLLLSVVFLSFLIALDVVKESSDD
ncbi:hypothetical protein CI238_01642 [Colletotrichum incanum]|uniref:Uncharacterized protein n=1 Tax=Colletotrichum incanum TaxID=1573173 RepID=A0A162PEH2_COLIC|nr:hypothetical protein CI238_01642 [Colletotrichum incanum]OHW98891.1 hypothetical protein CSPAE12_02399 [Colletotrichum incanum]